VNTAAMCNLALDFLIQHIENEHYRPHGRSFIDGTVVVKQSIKEADDFGALQPHRYRT
jgi:hypothetical protein